MILLGIDIETTGLDESTSDIIEIGAVLWDTSTQMPIEMFSKLVKTKRVIPQEIADLTGITKESLKTHGYTLNKACNELTKLMYKADYLVAHNAGFEQKFLNPLATDFSLLPSKNLLDQDFKWIDTKTDIDYPKGKGDGRLVEIGVNHGVMNILPHRALTDVFVMLQVLAKYDINKVIENANTPTVTAYIVFPFDKTKEKNEKVKGLGYYWENDYKRWSKPIKENKIEEEKVKAENLGFNMKITRG